MNRPGDYVAVQTLAALDESGVLEVYATKLEIEGLSDAPYVVDLIPEGPGPQVGAYPDPHEYGSASSLVVESSDRFGTAVCGRPYNMSLATDGSGDWGVTVVFESELTLDCEAHTRAGGNLKFSATQEGTAPSDGGSLTELDERTSIELIAGDDGSDHELLIGDDEAAAFILASDALLTVQARGSWVEIKAATGFVLQVGSNLIPVDPHEPARIRFTDDGSQTTTLEGQSLTVLSGRASNVVVGDDERLPTMLGSLPGWLVSIWISIGSFLLGMYAQQFFGARSSPR